MGHKLAKYIVLNWACDMIKGPEKSEKEFCILTQLAIHNLDLVHNWRIGPEFRSRASTQMHTCIV